MGMLVAYPAAAGVHWQISDRFAIRADGGYSWSSSDTTESNTSEASTSSIGGSTIVFGGSSSTSHAESSSHVISLGLSALITVHKTDEVRLYVAPKVSFGISHLSGSITTEVMGPPELSAFFPDRDNAFSHSETSYSTGYSVSFGGSTMINRRFGVFAEAGLVFNHSDDPTLSVVVNGVPLGAGKVESSRKSLSTRGAVGIMLFF